LSGAALFGLFTCGVVSQLATTRLPASRVLALGMISMLVGLLLIGAGVALGLGASAPDTVLGFAILVGLGVVISGWVLLRRRS